MSNDIQKVEDNHGQIAQNISGDQNLFQYYNFIIKTSSNTAHNKIFNNIKEYIKHLEDNLPPLVFNVFIKNIKEIDYIKEQEDDEEYFYCIQNKATFLAYFHTFYWNQQLYKVCVELASKELKKYSEEQMEQTAEDYNSHTEIFNMLLSKEELDDLKINNNTSINYVTETEEDLEEDLYDYVLEEIEEKCEQDMINLKKNKEEEEIHDTHFFDFYYPKSYANYTMSKYNTIIYKTLSSMNPLLITAMIDKYRCRTF